MSPAFRPEVLSCPDRARNLIQKRDRTIRRLERVVEEKDRELALRDAELDRLAGLVLDLDVPTRGTKRSVPA